MFLGRRIAGRGRSARALAALAAVSACLGAVVALARGRAGGEAGLANHAPVAPAHGGTGTARSEAPPPRPSFIEKPEAASILSSTQFRFHVPPRSRRLQPELPAPAQPAAGGQPKPQRRFQCRYDGGQWQACGSPYRLGAVPPGAHAFAVRALSPAAAPGPPASYSWRQVDPKPISIAAADPAEALYPGLPPQPLKVVVSNPNDVPVEVTRLTVDLASATPSCPAQNFRLTPSTASPESPLPLPAGGSVSLPSGAISAPAIEMLDLPENQDACSGAQLDLVFEGVAHG
jgi:hypothetical protein